MGRPAKPYIWRDYYVTEAGGRGIHKLCPVEEGLTTAKKLLIEYQKKIFSEKEEERRAGLVASTAPFTIAHITAEFAQWKDATKKATTFEFYQKNLARFIEWYGQIEVKKFSLSLATDYITRLKKDGLADTTINHHLRAAKGVLNYATKCKRLAENPWREVELFADHQRKRIVTDEEFQKLLDACDQCVAYRGKISREDNAESMRGVLLVLRYTGMRPGELRKLRWDHLHLDEQLIIIPASEHKTGTTAKNPEDRMIPILEEAKNIFVQRQKKWGRQPYVFPNIMGKMWTDQLLSQRFARLRKRAGLTGLDRNGEAISLVNLRHTRLTEIGTTEGWDFFLVMKYAGHTNPKTTSRYIHAQKENLIRAAKDGEEKRNAAKQKDDDA